MTACRGARARGSRGEQRRTLRRARCARARRRAPDRRSAGAAARLARAEELARSANAQVLLRDPEPVGGLGHHAEPIAGVAGARSRDEQQADATRRRRARRARAADAAARARSARHRRSPSPSPPARRRRPRSPSSRRARRARRPRTRASRVALAPSSRPCTSPTAHVAAAPAASSLRDVGDRVGRRRASPSPRPAGTRHSACARRRSAAISLYARVRPRCRRARSSRRLASGRQLVEDGDVEVAVRGQRERARDRRRGHHEQVRRALRRRPCRAAARAARRRSDAARR